jgi:hypothetical protein
MAIKVRHDACIIPNVEERASRGAARKSAVVEMVGNVVILHQSDPGVRRIAPLIRRTRLFVGDII